MNVVNAEKVDITFPGHPSLKFIHLSFQGSSGGHTLIFRSSTPHISRNHFQCAGHACSARNYESVLSIPMRASSQIFQVSRFHFREIPLHLCKPLLNFTFSDCIPCSLRFCLRVVFQFKASSRCCFLQGDGPDEVTCCSSSQGTDGAQGRYENSPGFKLEKM